MDSIEKRREALLSKYRFVTSVSKKELAELQKKCNELDIPIGKVTPDIMEKVAMDDKSHFPHAGDRIIFKPSKRQKSLIKEVENMGYKNFYEWINQSEYDHLSPGTTNLMMDAWDAAVESYPEDRTKAEIKELRAVISKAMQMKCSCKENEGCTCDTYKARATAIFNLEKYLGKL